MTNERPMERAPIVEDELARKWWAIALRGVIAIIFGIAAFLFPGAAFLALVLVFAAYALVDGVFALVAGVRREEGRNWWMILGGLAGIFIGIVTPFMPGMTALLLVLFVGWWALITGALQLGAALAARAGTPVRWLLALDGVLSIALGGLIVLLPGPGAFALTMLIAAYAIVSGITLLILAFQLRLRARPVVRSTGSRAPA